MGPSFCCQAVHCGKSKYGRFNHVLPFVVRGPRRFWLYNTDSIPAAEGSESVTERRQVVMEERTRLRVLFGASHVMQLLL